MNKGDGAAEAWVSTFTKTLRQTLPQGQFILSHAPLAPWLSPNAQFAAGAYVTINKNVGALIDFVSVSHVRCGSSEDDSTHTTFVRSTTSSSTTRTCTPTARA